MEQPSKLTAKCPSCGAPIHLPFNTAATEIYNRKCPRDGRKMARGMVYVCHRWRIKVEPRKLPKEMGWAHIVTFYEVRKAQEIAAPNPQEITSS